MFKDSTENKRNFSFSEIGRNLWAHWIDW